MTYTNTLRTVPYSKEHQHIHQGQNAQQQQNMEAGGNGSPFLGTSLRFKPHGLYLKNIPHRNATCRVSPKHTETKTGNSAKPAVNRKDLILSIVCLTVWGDVAISDLCVAIE